MSNRLLIVVCAAAIFTCPLSAQDSTLKRRVVGVGITVPDVGLFLPINVSRRIRLEPFVDFFSTRADYPVTSDTAWDAVTRIGVGAFATFQAPERITMYVGPRVGLVRGSTKVNGPAGETSTESSGWFVAASLGGEYGFTARFSAGAEAKLQYEQTSSTSSGSSSIAPSLFARRWFSSGALVMRFYP